MIGSNSFNIYRNILSSKYIFLFIGQVFEICEKFDNYRENGVIINQNGALCIGMDGVGRGQSVYRFNVHLLLYIPPGLVIRI
jgi:hypothetical protein